MEMTLSSQEKHKMVFFVCFQPLDEVVNLRDLSSGSCLSFVLSPGFSEHSRYGSFFWICHSWQPLLFWFTYFFYSRKDVSVPFIFSSLLRDYYLIQISFVFQEKYLCVCTDWATWQGQDGKLFLIRVTIIQWRV